MGDERAAGVRREERLAAGKSSAEIVESVHEGELRSSFRVYRKEWRFDTRHDSPKGAWHRFEHTYANRLEKTDYEVREDSDRAKAFALWVRIWNVVGEYKEREDAEAVEASLRADGFQDVELVTRNSREEHRLRNYGKLKLVGR